MRMKQETIATIIDLVAAANPTRNMGNLNRRVKKLFEELGEISEAELNATATSTYKNKTWEDVQEEAADVLIVAIDIALTQLNDKDFDMREQVSDVEMWLPTMAALGYDDVFWLVAVNAGRFGPNYKTVPIAARHYSGDAVRYAFALAEIVFPHQEPALLGMVVKKLQKWLDNRAKNVVATDAE
jgi:NTP pyrophosphatase (non-canonical NTP hydrolase)